MTYFLSCFSSSIDLLVRTLLKILMNTTQNAPPGSGYNPRSFKSEDAATLEVQCRFVRARMKISASAVLVLLTLTQLSDGYPTLKTIQKELQRLMVLKPPQGPF